ncbi:hypothetical protein E4U31_001526 [Claviceps sp. LM219 group G6]|nr:hypothetical protein E4U31_001526 [Claviceps sp. LM219 group G6]
MHCEKVLKTIAKDRGDGAFCDLEIVCGETRFQAHRNVVCSHSGVIRAACLDLSKDIASRSSVFEIKESPPELVRRMLDYIYTGNYDGFSSNVPVEEDQTPSQEAVKCAIIKSTMTLHAKMMELGDMYMVDGLSALANKKITVILREQTSRKILEDFIPEIYALKFESSHTLRKSVTDCMREKRLEKTPLAGDVDKALEVAMKNVPEFTCDFLKSFIINAPQCDVCRNEAIERISARSVPRRLRKGQ